MVVKKRENAVGDRLQKEWDRLAPQREELEQDGEDRLAEIMEECQLRANLGRPKGDLIFDPHPGLVAELPLLPQHDARPHPRYIEAEHQFAPVLTSGTGVPTETREYTRYELAKDGFGDRMLKNCEVIQHHTGRHQPTGANSTRQMLEAWEDGNEIILELTGKP